MRIPPSRTPLRPAGSARSTAAPEPVVAKAGPVNCAALLLACLLLSVQLVLAVALPIELPRAWLPITQALGWLILGAVAGRLLPLATSRWRQWRQRRAERRAATQRLAQARGNPRLMAEITFAHMRRTLDHEPVLGNEEAAYGFYVGDEWEHETRA